MMGVRVSAVAMFTLLVLSACGGGVETTGTGGNTTTTTTTTGTGGSGGGIAGSDCETDADCGGNTCTAMTPGGFKICLSPPPEATMCSGGGPAVDQCCQSTECLGGGKCYLSTTVPYCSGPAMAEYNFCAGDACQSDTDCQGAGVQQICAPAGAFGQPGRACVNAYCHTDAECTAKPGGHCAPVLRTCCPLPAGLACVYPGGCRRSQDCGNTGNQHCEIDATSHEGTCAPGEEACPA